jgi:hypothetical protein
LRALLTGQIVQPTPNPENPASFHQTAQCLSGRIWLSKVSKMHWREHGSPPAGAHVPEDCDINRLHVNFHSIPSQDLHSFCDANQPNLPRQM